jgi:uncharacterized protein (TIGR02391 family)
MGNILGVFENIVRSAFKFSEVESEDREVQHPFDLRNIYPGFPKIVKDLFDNGHYSQSTFEAFKFVDNEIQRISGISESGFKLMMQALAETSLSVSLNSNITQSEKDEQKGFQFIFAGSTLAIRNPRGHDIMEDSLDICLDHLCLASMLLRKLEQAGYRITVY